MREAVAGGLVLPNVIPREEKLPVAIRAGDFCVLYFCAAGGTAFHQSAHSGRFDARNSSTRMRSRALVVRSISSCRRGGKDVIAWCAVSLPTRSSTHVCAHPSTIRTTPISIHHGLYCSSISLHKPSRSAPSSASSTVQLPTWCSSAILVHRQAAHHFSSLPSCVWTNTDARLAQCELVARVASTFGYGSLEPFQSDENICSNCCLPRHLFHKIGASALAHH